MPASRELNALAPPNPQVAEAWIEILLMTIVTVLRESADLYECRCFSQFHLTKTTRDFAKLHRYAQSP